MNHLAVPTADPERGAEFYCEVLGFKRMPRPAFSFRGAWLMRRETGVMIHLIHDELFQPPADRKINSRSNHFAMQVEDYDGAVRQLAEHRVPFVEHVLPEYGYRQAFFQDPDGNVIELGEWPSAAVMFPQLAAETLERG